MKLSDLIPHTSTWLGVPKATVESIAKQLRPAGLISSGGRGPGGAEMTVDDKVNLFLAACGVDVATRAADQVRIWRRLQRLHSEPGAWLKGKEDDRFAFLKANNVRDFIVELITKDLNNGALSSWLKEADDALHKSLQRSGGPNHEITLDFHVDDYALTLTVSRYCVLNDVFPDLKQMSADTIQIRFIRPPPGANDYVPKATEEYRAPSSIIRRLRENNIVGWGTCLSE